MGLPVFAAVPAVRRLAPSEIVAGPVLNSAAIDLQALRPDAAMLGTASAEAPDRETPAMETDAVHPTMGRLATVNAVTASAATGLSMGRAGMLAHADRDRKAPNAADLRKTAKTVPLGVNAVSVLALEGRLETAKGLGGRAPSAVRVTAKIG